MAPDAGKHGSSALRIGVIGAGRIGAFHVRTLLALSGIASVTVCDADAARARQASRPSSASSVAATPESLIACGVDARRDRDAHAGARADDQARRRRRPAGVLREARGARARRPGRPSSRTSSARARSCRWASSAASTPATVAARDGDRRRRARPPARRAARDARSRSARRGLHRGLGRHLPRPPHPRLRRPALRHGRGDRRGLRRRRRARDAVVRRSRRRRRRGLRCSS